MEKVVLQTYNSETHERKREIFDKFPIAIGRSFTNDLILSDPYVSEKHVLVTCEDDVIRVEDLGSENGLFLNGDVETRHKAVIVSGESFLLGKTQVHLFLESHPVAVTKKLRQIKGVTKILLKQSKSLLLLLLLSNILISLYSTFVTTINELTFTKLIGPILFVFFCGLGGASFWAFIGHLNKKKIRFIAHLNVFLAAFVLLVAAEFITSFIAFQFNSNVLYMLLSCLVTLVVIFTVFNYNLFFATSLSFKNRMRITSAVVASIACLMVLGSVAAHDSFKGKISYYSTIFPSNFKLIPSNDVTSFVSKSEHIF